MLSAGEMASVFSWVAPGSNVQADGFSVGTSSARGIHSTRAA